MKSDDSLVVGRWRNGRSKGTSRMLDVSLIAHEEEGIN